MNGSNVLPPGLELAVRVEEIHFNHDPNAATADALTIRQNAAGAPIAAPEWRTGAAPAPAAYARFAVGPTVAIKAVFSGGPAGGSVEIRARDADFPPPRPPGCFGWLVWVLALLLRALFGNVLGDVRKTPVSFAGGTSGLTTFPLRRHRLKTAGVGVHSTRWKWQYKSDSGWVDFDETQHTIYLVLDVPRGPWQQGGGDPTQLPWVDALEHACRWAVGARTKDEAAARITRAVNTKPTQSYTPATMFGWTTYSLGSYLAHLASGLPFSLNCTDCADAVTTFANLLGCDLYAGRFFNMDTRPFLTLDGNPATAGDWVTWSWSYHEICWLQQIGQNELIYDGCLQVDMDDDYTDGVHVARHPVKMRFGMSAPDDYRYRLIDSGLGTLENIPRRRRVV
jgi:hypothetical protein